MHAFTRFTSVVLGAAAALLLTTSAASAQSLGTFSFALAPYCNNAVMVVTQEGSTYRLAGWDDNCGAVQRFPITGTIAFNLDGTLNISFTTIRTNGIAVDTSIRNFNLGGFTGAWTDSAGNSGTSGIQGLSAPAQTATPRPGPSSTVPSNSVTTVNIVDNSITAVDVDPTQVQLRVSGTCPAGRYVRSIDAAGNVVCGVGAFTQSTEGSQLLGGLTTSCQSVGSLAFTIPANGTLTCDAIQHAVLNHTNGVDPSRITAEIETTAAACPDSLLAGVYEIPGQLASYNGQNISVPVKRTFSVTAGALTVYLNSRLYNLTASPQYGYGLSCTFTPQ